MKLSNKIAYTLIGIVLAIAGTVYANQTIPNSTQKGDVATGLANGQYILLHPGSNGTVLTASSSAANGLDWTSVGGTGTVTSVDMTVPTGLAISGNPITGAGTLALSLQSGYNIPLTASTTNWNTFYNTPSNRITAGTDLSWSGNTLNFSNPGFISGVAWGDITGTLSSQTDLQNALNAKLSTTTAAATYQPIGTYVTSVTASGNLSSSGGTTPAITITANPTFTKGIFTNASTTNLTVSGNTWLTGISDGCLYTSSGMVTSTGSACGTGSGGITNAYASSTFPSFSYGSSTYATILNYPTYTYASSTYYAASNPNGYYAPTGFVAGSNITITTSTPGQITIAASGGGSPAGSSYQLQYNNGGSFGASSSLNWSNLNTLAITGSTTISNLLSVSGATTLHGAVTIGDSTNGGSNLVWYAQDGPPTFHTLTLSVSSLGGTNKTISFPNNNGTFALGTGTVGKVARWSDANTLTTGKLLDNGTVTGVNATSSTITFNVQGNSGTSDILNVASSSGASYLKVLPSGTLQLPLLTTAGVLVNDASGNVSTSTSVPLETLGFTVDGGSSVITTGLKGCIAVPYAATIQSWTMLSTDASFTAGTSTVEIWKTPLTSYPPSNSNVMTGSAPPKLTGTASSTSSTLTGWTTTITPNDTLCFNVTSTVASLKRVTLELNVKKN